MSCAFSRSAMASSRWWRSSARKPASYHASHSPGPMVTASLSRSDARSKLPGPRRTSRGPLLLRGRVGDADLTCLRVAGLVGAERLPLDDAEHLLERGGRDLLLGGAELLGRGRAAQRLGEALVGVGGAVERRRRPLGIV